MRKNRCRGLGCFMTGCIALALIALSNSQAWADDSTCITCHTDLELLEDNLAEVKTQTSAMQAGSG